MDIDQEGRAVLTKHSVEGLGGSALVVVNVYCPHVEEDREDRQQFKIKFYHALQNRVAALQRAGKWVLAEVCMGRTIFAGYYTSAPPPHAVLLW